MAAGRGGAGGGGGRSDVGLGVAGWPGGACRDCTAREFAVALAEPPLPAAFLVSSPARSFFVSSRRAAHAGQLPFESEILLLRR